MLWKEAESRNGEKERERVGGGIRKNQGRSGKIRKGKWDGPALLCIGPNSPLQYSWSHASQQQGMISCLSRHLNTSRPIHMCYGTSHTSKEANGKTRTGSQETGYNQGNRSELVAVRLRNVISELAKGRLHIQYLEIKSGQEECQSGPKKQATLFASIGTADSTSNWMSNQHRLNFSYCCDTKMKKKISKYTGNGQGFCHKVFHIPE